jgi:hypothetical protein
MQYNKLVHGEALSRDKFKSPSREFGIMPFWFWNGEMKYEEMEYQLWEYYNKGIPGIYIHARFGILEPIGYLTDDWFDRVKFTIEKAQEIGLQVWVYDEYNWPSGTAGKEVMKRKPDLTQRYLELVEGNIAGQYFQFMEGTDSRYNDLEESEPVYACAILLKDLEKGNPRFVNLMPSLSFDKVITWEAPKGPWKMFYFIERKASWYSDMLNPETTKEFLKLTHERYKKYLGEKEFKNIKGFYTDEPAMHYFEVARDNYIIPWSKQMFKIFREHNGYDLKQHLPHLFFDIGSESEKIRYDFYNALTKQYEKTFYKEIADWCEENDMVFTGHLLFEESLRLHSRTGGNLFKHLRHMHMTGVDHLYPRIGTREMPDEHVALKLASSAAHQFGSTRLLCESMGGSYWDCTMERMKWIADWEYVLGVNLLNPHGFHYSIEGERKRDWPPSQFYHHTWWKQYGMFNSYIARLSYILSGGRHICKTAILYPINSIWALYTPQSRNKTGTTIENEFNYMTDRLLRLHMDFDYIDEDILKECRIEGGKLLIRDEAYEVLILPAATHIKASTLDILEKFIKSGGKVIADTMLPRRSIEGEAENFDGRIESLFGVSAEEVNNAYLNGEAKEYSLAVKDIGENGGRTVLIKGPSLSAGDGLDVLKQAMLCCIKPEIMIDSEEVFYLHRNKDGQDFYFLVNPTSEEIEINISIEGEFAPELWNLLNGEITPVRVFNIKEGKTYFKLHMHPFGSYMIGVSPLKEDLRIVESDIEIDEVLELKVKGHGCLPEGGRLKAVIRGIEKTVPIPAAALPIPISLNGEWKISTDRPNVILTDKWKVSYDNGQCPADFCSDEYSFDGFYDFRMGAWETQLPEERDEAVYPVRLWYVTDIYADYVPDDLKILIDGFKGSDYRLLVNGKPITAEPFRSFLDAEIKEVPAADSFKKGRNTIAILLTVNKKSDGMVDLLKLTGTFAVSERNGRETICAPVDAIQTGDFTIQGFPYFSGTMEYFREFELPETFIGCKITLKADPGTDVIEADINGIQAGVCLWKPYEIDITKLVKPGKNRISVRVVNTLFNILEGVKQPSGLFDIKLVPSSIFEIDLK